MPLRQYGVLIMLDVVEVLTVGRIRQGCDQTADPVELFRGSILGRTGEISRRPMNIGVKRRHRIKGIGRKGQPLHGAERLRNIASDLNQCHKVISIDADGTVSPSHGSLSVSGIGIEGRSLIVGGKKIFHILYRQFFFRDQAPWNIIRFRSKIRPRSVPTVGMRIQVPAHIPGTRRVINMIRIVMGTESGARVKRFLRR